VNLNLIVIVKLSGNNDNKQKSKLQYNMSFRQIIYRSPLATFLCVHVCVFWLIIYMKYIYWDKTLYVLSFLLVCVLELCTDWSAPHTRPNRQLLNPQPTQSLISQPNRTQTHSKNILNPYSTQPTKPYPVRTQHTLIEL